MKKKKHGGAVLMLVGATFLVLAAALLVWNMRQQSLAGEGADAVLAALTTAIKTQGQPETADVPETTPEESTIDLTVPLEERVMPTYELEGVRYIGVLEIPALGIQLPVSNEWSYDQLQVSPCRYTGSVYTDDLVIAAHNYDTHFGGLSELAAGETVRLYSADGEVYTFTVSALETLQPTDVEYMTAGEYPLTLFTCTWGGASRVTVRCDKAAGE